ncbi:MAG: hypothetical protein ABI972_17460 [Acidobacteriota bacterium]
MRITQLGVLWTMTLAAADMTPERIPLPEISCTAPDAAPFDFPKIGHDRHAVIVVEGAGCSGTLLAGKQPIGKVSEGAKPARFDFAEQLRLAEPPPLSFRPSEAGFGEIRLALVVTPRVYFYNLRYAGGVVTLTARNTLDNTADLYFRVEAQGKPAVERADNLGPNLERDYTFEIGGLSRGDRVRVGMEKAPEALESGYRYTDLLRVER